MEFRSFTTALATVLGRAGQLDSPYTVVEADGLDPVIRRCVEQFLASDTVLPARFLAHVEADGVEHLYALSVTKAEKKPLAYIWVWLDYAGEVVGVFELPS